MTTLQNSYCVPKMNEERSLISEALTEYNHGVLFQFRQFKENQCAVSDYTFSIAETTAIECGKELVSVHKFLDLLHDRIAPWRLEEVGGEQSEDGNAWLIECGQIICVGFYSDGGVSVSIHYDYASIPAYITTFTDLLTLIKFLTPPAQ